MDHHVPPEALRPGPEAQPSVPAGPIHVHHPPPGGRDVWRQCHARTREACCSRRHSRVRRLRAVPLISEGSLADLTARLPAGAAIERPISVKRFRPNVVVKGIAAYDEDLAATIHVGDGGLSLSGAAGSGVFLTLVCFCRSFYFILCFFMFRTRSSPGSTRPLNPALAS